MATRTPNLQSRDQNHRDWGNFASGPVLPNASGAPLLASSEWSKLEAGDQAQVILATHAETWICFDPGTDGGNDAVWQQSSRRRICIWRANGLLAGYDLQPGSYDGGLVTDAQVQAGLGLFDATLHVYEPGVILSLVCIQQTPAAAAASTTVEFYRVRGAYPGMIVSLGTVTLTNTLAFERVSVVPGTTDLEPDDMLFVSFAAAPTTDLVAAEVSAHLEIA